MTNFWLARMHPMILRALQNKQSGGICEVTSHDADGVCTEHQEPQLQPVPQPQNGIVQFADSDGESGGSSPYLMPGQCVVFRDLEKAKDLNGQLGTIMRFDTKAERSAVKVYGRDKELAVRFANLQLLETPGLHSKKGGYGC